MRVKDLIKDDKGKICGLILRDELTGKMDSCPGSTTVEQLTLYPKIEGSNPPLALEIGKTIFNVGQFFPVGFRQSYKKFAAVSHAFS